MATDDDKRGWAKAAVARNPQLQRGRVWCHECGAKQDVDSASCLYGGWPKHCGYTMSLDSPEERCKEVPHG